MKRADVRFLVSVFAMDAEPVFQRMRGDETTIAFCEMQCVLAATAVRNILESSTPKSRADFVARWMQSAEERTRKAKAAALAGANKKTAATAKQSRRAKV